jgi:hypothetical protein
VSKEQRIGSHTVSWLTAHIVWVTKYRYKVLEGDIQKRCRDLVKQICDSEDVKILKGTSNNSVFKNQFGDKFIWSRYFIEKKLSRCFFDVFRPHCGLNIIKWTHLSREGF